MNLALLPGLLLASAVLVAPWPLARSFAQRLRGEGPDQGVVVLAAVVAWCALQVGVGLLLGLLHVLHLPGLLVAEALVAGAGLVVWRRSTPTQGDAPEPLDAPLLLTVLVAAAVATWKFLAVPITNFDSVAYHLPAMVRWVQDSHLAVASELGNAAHYPFNWELLGAMAFLPVGLDLWVALPNLMGWVLLGLATRTLAERHGAAADAAKVAAVLLLCTPSVLARIEAIQPDIPLAGFFLAAIVFVDRWRFDARAHDAALALVCLALLAGSKTSGLAYAAMVLVLAGAPAVWARRRSADSWSKVLRLHGMPRWTVTAWVAVAALLGGTWYVRNWLFTGNPTGFLEISWAGVQVFDGAVSTADLAPTTLARIFEPARGEHWTILAGVSRTWLGLPVLFFLLGAVGLVRDLDRRSHRICRRLLAGTAAAAVAALILYWHTPFSGDNGEHGLQLTPWIHVGLRYAYPALGCLAVLAACGATAWGIGTRWLLAIAVVSAVHGVAWTLAPSALAMAISTTAALAMVLAWRTSASRPVLRRATWAGAVILVLAVSLRAEPGRTAGRSRWYGTVDGFLDGLPASTVASAGTVRRYALYGSDWSRRVIPADPVAPDYRAWISQLRSLRTPILVLPTGDRPAWPEKTRVLGWIAEHPEVFRLEFAAESVRNDLAVYRLSLPIS